MKKILLILGLGGLGYGLYNYFSKQLLLALDWDFEIKDLKVNSIDRNGTNLDILISVLNKSSFDVGVKDYDIEVLYEGVKIGNAKSSRNFTVEADSWFDVPVKAYLDFSLSVGVLDELGLGILKDKPFKIDLKGKMNVVFAGLPKEVIFNVKDVVVSENVGDDLGLSKEVNKLNEFLSKLNIKL